MTPALPRRVVAWRGRGREDFDGLVAGGLVLCSRWFRSSYKDRYVLACLTNMSASHGLIRLHGVISKPSSYLDCTGWHQIVRVTSACGPGGSAGWAGLAQ